MDTTTPRKYESVNRLSQIHGYGRDTFVRLLTALLVNNTNIRAIKIGTKTMYRRAVDIERGLLERVGRLLVMAPEFGWDDVGTWAGLRRVRDLDDAGNGALGDAHFTDATGNVVHAESGTVVMFGVSQLLVVTRAGLTFVTTLDRAADLKPLLDSLPGSARINPGSLGQ